MSHQNRRRIGVTVFCLIIANSLFAGLIIYLDSYSVSIWDYETQVGPASIILSATTPLPDAAVIRELDGVSKAANFKRAWANVVAYPPGYNSTTVYAQDSDKSVSHSLALPPPEPELNMSVRVVTFEQDMIEQYPTVFNLTDGRWPEAPNEVAFSAWLMDWFVVDVGAVVTYRNTHQWIYHTLYVVGAFDRPEIDNRNQGYYYFGDMMATEEMFGDIDVFYYSYIDIDRTSVSPFSASSSIGSLTEVEEHIRNLDPRYSSFHLTSFSLDDVLAKGIQRYLDWLASARVDYIVRTQTSLFLAVVLSSLTIQFNLREQSEKKRLLIARGASQRQVTLSQFREVFFLTFISLLSAIGIGILVSRIGLASRGFFVFDSLESFTQPVLITLDSMVYMIIFCLLLPSIVFSLFQGDTTLKKTEETEQRRIGKLVKGVRRLRWDVAVVFLSLALLLASWETGAEIITIPLISYTIYSLPLFLAVGITSLLSKAMRTTSEWFSRGLGRVSGGLTSSIGGRRIGKRAKSAGPTILLVALALSLVWNNAIVAETIPHTALSHARFAIGGDISVRLDPIQREHWSELMTVISENPDVAATSFVGAHSLSLSSELQDTTEFVVVDSDEYMRVGYDAFGEKLDESLLNEILEKLGQNPSGAIVTTDISDTYELIEGDSIRAFRGNGSDIETLVFNLIGIVDSLPDTMVTSRGYHPPLTGDSTTQVGRQKIWVNKDYALELLGEEEETSMFICVRLRDGVDGKSVLDTIFESGGDIILGYSTALDYAEEFVISTQYLSNRSLDTLMTVLLLATLSGSLVLYTFSNRDDRKNEEVLLRVIGTDKRSIQWTRQVEMLSLLAHTLLLLILCAPVILQNTFTILIYTNSVSLISYPQPLLPIIPWMTFAGLLLLVIGLSSVLMVSIAKVDHRQNLVDDKNEVWDETRILRRDN